MLTQLHEVGNIVILTLPSKQRHRKGKNSPKVQRSNLVNQDWETIPEFLLLTYRLLRSPLLCRRMGMTMTTSPPKETDAVLEGGEEDWAWAPDSTVFFSCA